ncbi:MAG: HAD family hydrolase, partial [Paracoccaceae bacterium]|nr:HAD family hydrolase [Paracoccaceae bacterium]
AFLPGIDHQALTDRMNVLATLAPMAEAVPLAPLLAGLRARGLRLGLATNDAEAPARMHLANVGVAQFFDFIAGFDSGHGGKPAPGQLLAFAAHTGLDPSRVVMVGDSRHDLDAGRAAGMRTVAVLTGIAKAADLAPHADAVLPDISGLAAWIDGLRGA